MKESIHDEDSSESSKHRWIFTQADEEKRKDNHKEKKSYHTTLYELLNIPTLWYIVMFGTHDEVRIACEEIITQPSHLTFERCQRNRILIYFCNSTTRWSCLSETMPERLFEKSYKANIHAFKMSRSRSFTSDNLGEFWTKLKDGECSSQENENDGGD